MGPEARLENRVVDAVNRAGGFAYKTAGGHTGMPDRIVILPEGRIVFVEMKAPGGVLSPIQAVTIDRLQQLGHEVRVLRGEDETNAFIDEIREGVIE